MRPRPRRTSARRTAPRLAVTVALAGAFALGSIAGSIGRSAGLPDSAPVEPRRVLLVGDSLMSQTGPDLRELLQAQGAEVQLHAVPGSGLVNPGSPVDWVARIEPLVESFRPDDVVVLLVGNYFPPYMQLDGQEVRPFSQEFFEQWSRRADELMATISKAAKVRGVPNATGTSSGADTIVWWVKPPSMGPAELDGRSDAIDLILERLANDWPTAHPIAADTALAGPAGGYRSSITRADGSTVQLRDADGVHLAPGGARLLARHIARAVFAAGA